MENQIQFTKKKISLIFVIKIVTQEIACSADDLAPEDTLASPLLFFPSHPSQCQPNDVKC